MSWTLLLEGKYSKSVKIKKIRRGGTPLERKLQRSAIGVENRLRQKVKLFSGEISVSVEVKPRLLKGRQEVKYF